MITEFLITAGEQPKRLDVFLVNRERDMSRSALQRLIELGRIRINNAIVKPSQKIKPGDKITVREVSRKLTYFKAPGYIALVEHIPVTASQKISRAEVKQKAIQSLASGQAMDLREFKKRKPS